MPAEKPADADVLLAKQPVTPFNITRNVMGADSSGRLN